MRNATDYFAGKGLYQIPELRRDRLASLRGELYIWNSAPQKNTAHSDSTIAFYTDDRRFQGCYERPIKFVRKLVEMRPAALVLPNFSMWATMPRALQIHAAFRARWVGRYWQEHGFDVIPDINFSDESSLEFALEGIPQRAPAVAVQAHCGQRHSEERHEGSRILKLALDRLQPLSVIVYGTKYREEYSKSIPDGVQAVFCTTRLDLMRGRMNGA